MNVSDMVDGSADGVQKGSAATDEVFLIRNGRHLIQRLAVMQDLDLVIKKDRGDQCFSGFPLLLFQHGVVPADGISFQPGHGSASIKDKNDFGKTFLHNEFLLFLLAGVPGCFLC